MFSDSEAQRILEVHFSRPVHSSAQCSFYLLTWNRSYWLQFFLFVLLMFILTKFKPFLDSDFCLLVILGFVTLYKETGLLLRRHSIFACACKQSRIEFLPANCSRQSLISVEMLEGHSDGLNGLFYGNACSFHVRRFEGTLTLSAFAAERTLSGRLVSPAV